LAPWWSWRFATQSGSLSAHAMSDLAWGYAYATSVLAIMWGGWLVVLIFTYLTEYCYLRPPIARRAVRFAKLGPLIPIWPIAFTVSGARLAIQITKDARR
jgi:hypothetical protein